ncbi:phosphopantetheine-binding protein [Streptomyces sp. NPDC002790]|uniref:phosphopantetheine-binding protein n=1 Tax=Streptomyces sp. NPDC002790 TaxID=3154431 RepID=UPI0033265EE5
MAQTMGDLLSRSPLDHDEDFFLTGGDSLRAVELISRLTEQFAPDDAEKSAELGSMLLVAVFDEATPRSVSAVIQQHLD